MRDKFGKDGLEVLGVLLDDPKDKVLRADGEKYLAKAKPNFANVYLDAPPEVWQKKLRFDSYPGVYVFNRNNEYVKKLPLLDEKGDVKEEVDYDVVENVVVGLMPKK